MKKVRAWWWLILAVAAAMAMVVAVACSAAPTATPAPTPTPTPPPDPRALLDAALQQLETEPYLSFVFEHPVGNTPLGAGVALTRAEGAADRPNRFRASIDMDAQGTPLNLGIIVTENESFVTNPINGEWTPTTSPEQIPFRFEFIGEVIGGLVGGMAEPKLAGVDSVDGNPAYLIRGVTPTAALGEVIPGTLPDGQVLVELWVEQASGKLVQARATGSLTVGDGADSVRLLTLEALSQPPEISPP